MLTRIIEIGPNAIGRIDKQDNVTAVKVLCTKNLDNNLCVIAVSSNRVLLAHIHSNTNIKLFAEQFRWLFAGRYKLIIGRNKGPLPSDAELPRVSNFNLDDFLKELTGSLNELTIPVWNSLKTYHLTTGCIAVQVADGNVKMITPSLATEKAAHAESRQAINFFNLLSSTIEDNSNYYLDLQFDVDHWTKMPALSAISHRLFVNSIIAKDWDSMVDRLLRDQIVPKKVTHLLESCQTSVMKHTQSIHKYRTSTVSSNKIGDNRIMLDIPSSPMELKEMLTLYFNRARESCLKEIYLFTGKGKGTATRDPRGVLEALPYLLESYNEQIASINKDNGVYKIILKQKSTALEPAQQDLSRWLSPNVEDQEVYVNTLKERARHNDVKALISLATVYINTSDQSLNQAKEGIQLLDRAKQLGSVEACIELGKIYLDGQVVKQDYKRAVTFFQIAAKASNPAGQFWLAKCYLYGQGIEQNDALAMRWLRKAANQGFADAQISIGACCLEGPLSLNNPALEIDYIRKAAAQNLPSALVMLGRCYATGSYVDQNYKQAFICYRAAAEANDMYALYQVGVYYLEGRGGLKQDSGKAFEWFMKAAELGESDAQGRVALAYLQGDGVEHDLAKAKFWLKKSSAQGNLTAKQYLNDLTKGLVDDKIEDKFASAYDHFISNQMQQLEDSDVYYYTLGELAYMLLTIAWYMTANEYRNQLKPTYSLLYNEFVKRTANISVTPPEKQAKEKLTDYMLKYIENIGDTLKGSLLAIYFQIGFKMMAVKMIKLTVAEEEVEIVNELVHYLHDICNYSQLVAIDKSCITKIEQALNEQFTQSKKIAFSSKQFVLRFEQLEDELKSQLFSMNRLGKNQEGKTIVAASRPNHVACAVVSYLGIMQCLGTAMIKNYKNSAKTSRINPSKLPNTIDDLDILARNITAAEFPNINQAGISQFGLIYFEKRNGFWNVVKNKASVDYVNMLDEKEFAFDDISKDADEDGYASSCLPF